MHHLSSQKLRYSDYKLQTGINLKVSIIKLLNCYIVGE